MKLKFVTALTGFFFWSSMLFAQDASPEKWLGYWKGTVSAGPMQIGLSFHVTRVEGRYKSTLDVPMQGLKEYAVESTVLDEETSSLTWTMGFGATFTGHLTGLTTLEHKAAPEICEISTHGPAGCTKAL